QTMLPPTPHVTATRIVRTPSDSLEVSFNWWISNREASRDFGPQTRVNYRYLGHAGSGTPEGDRNKYHFLRNREFDYDQATVASISQLDPVWFPPPPDEVDIWATGLDTRYLLSFGPFDIEPGQSLPVSLAYVAGENFHSDPGNFPRFESDPTDWQRYYAGLNFDDLGLNATWADWIYDNPGVDTDSDGYAGEATICSRGGDSTLRIDTFYDTLNDTAIVSYDSVWDYELADTIWRKGDGVPDFRGASPPPAPTAYTSSKGVPGLRVEPQIGAVRVMWNGVRTENARDVFSREEDFEGYRVWLARDNRQSSYTLLASYDLEDFNKYIWSAELRQYLLLDTPFPLIELQTLYGDGDTLWNPLAFSRSNPLRISGLDPDTGEPFDSVLYFEIQDFNRSVLGNFANATTGIRKVYPDAELPPSLVPDSIPDSVYDIHVTGDGFLKYYEYEYVIEDLLPTVPYWINVTAFDYGSPQSGLPALETNPTIGPVITYPLESVDRVVSENLKVFVYPNPYRIDADYRGRGFEGRDQADRPADRTRAVHFANLPPDCTIRVFSLDGDLIREIRHDVDPSDPLANHDTWDMITRNTQMIVSGMYYWTVEDRHGHTQIGKLVVIM
ncbi:MAG: hypothetical protein KKA42_12660, partial [candidate division Zixibacteria bacterium]|nr:hypothetical protein [candidate division Zixibacteria bacterium]